MASSQQTMGVVALAGAVTALAAVPATLVATGTLGRVQRNDPDLLLGALGLGVLSALVWVVDSAGRAGEGQTTKAGARAAIRGPALFSAGFAALAVVGAAILAVMAAGEEQKPNVTTEMSGDGRTLTASVSGSNYASDDEIVVVVEGLDADRNVKAELARAYTGPDADGNLKFPIKVRVAPSGHAMIGVRAYNRSDKGSPECGPKATYGPGSRGAGCATTPAAAVMKPRLTATWDGSGPTANSVTLTLRASNTERTLLQVVADRGREPVVLKRAVYASDGYGELDATVRVPVPSGTERICAQAQTVADGGTINRPRCFDAAQVPAEATFFELKVPS